jgi:hypothetical protein
MGWDPQGVEPRADSYVQPRGQRVTEVDAQAFARSLEQGLEYVPDETVPLTGCEFGDEHTLGLLREAEQGRSPSGSVVTAARELLSGPPKNELLGLISFLRRGAFAVSAGR